jgi:hypothetical protein
MPKAKEAASLLVRILTYRGRTVPDYARKLAAGTSENNSHRVELELFARLSQASDRTQGDLFRTFPEVKVWFDQYMIDNKDSIAVHVYEQACARSVNRRD